MKNNIWFHADDFGVTTGQSERILDCYQNGAFTGEMTMEEMIDFCAPVMAQANAGMTEEQAKAQMYRFFPMLLRWKKG